MSLLEFVGVLFLGANLCSADFLMFVVFANHSEGHDRKTLRLLPASCTRAAA